MDFSISLRMQLAWHSEQFPTSVRLYLNGTLSTIVRLVGRHYRSATRATLPKAASHRFLPLLQSDTIVTQPLLAATNCTNHKPSLELACLRALTASQLLAVTPFSATVIQDTLTASRQYPVVDGRLITAQPSRMIANGEGSKGAFQKGVLPTRRSEQVWLIDNKQKRDQDFMRTFLYRQCLFAWIGALRQSLVRTRLWVSFTGKNLP